VVLLFSRNKKLNIISIGSGTITSPRWPVKYSYNSIGGSDRICEWEIIRQSDEVIQVNFMDVDIGVPGWLGCNIAPYLEVKGKFPVYLSVSKNYCLSDV